MAKPKGNKKSKPAKGCRRSNRLRNLPAGPALQPPTRKKAQKAKKAVQSKCKALKKKRKTRKLSTYCLFVRHVYNHSKKNGYCLFGKAFMEQAARCWNRLSPAQKLSFQNGGLLNMPKPPGCGDDNNANGWIPKQPYP